MNKRLATLSKSDIIHPVCHPVCLTQSHQHLMKNKWELDQPSFAALLNLFDPDPVQAGEQFELLRIRLLRFFQERRCVTATEQVDITFDRMAHKLAQGEQIENPNLYAFSVAKLVFLEYKAKVRRQSDFEETEHILTQGAVHLSFVTQLFDEDEQEVRLSCLTECLKNLQEDDQKLILGYYDGEKAEHQRKQLAEQFNLSVAALATKAFRLREKLLVCIKKRLKRRR